MSVQGTPIKIPISSLRKDELPLSPPKEYTATFQQLPAPRKCKHKQRGKGKYRPSSYNRTLPQHPHSDESESSELNDVIHSLTLGNRITLPSTPPEESMITTTLSERALGKNHSKCHLNCRVRRGLLMDSRLCGELMEGQ
jgi:hypothetical protein